MPDVRFATVVSCAIGVMSALIGLAAAVMLAAAQTAPDTWVIDHVNIVDGNGGGVIRDGTIVVEGGRIRAAGRRQAVATTRGRTLNRPASGPSRA